MKITFSQNAWEEFEYWQSADRGIMKRIFALIRDIQREPFVGIGKPEPLKHQYSGFWSRRINEEHRLVYCIQDNTLIIAQCRYHY